MATANDHPRPWALLFFPPDDFAAHVASRVPKVLTDLETHVYDQSEWDIVVTFREHSSDFDPHLHVLSFGARWLRGTEGGLGVLTRDFESYSTVIKTPEGVASRIERLLADTVIPNIDTSNTLETWTASDLNGQSVDRDDLGGQISPWIHVGPLKRVIAFEYTRQHEGRTVLHWALPSQTARHDLWLDAFLWRLMEIDPDLFPGDPAWATGAAWAPPEVRTHLLAAENLRDELARETRRLEDAITASEARISAASEAALAGPLRLLTEQGEPLRLAVQEALGDLGFDVTDMDPIHQEKHGAKFEDLRATDPEDDGWIAIIEVKGFGKGVKVTEIDKVTRRPLRRYLLDHGDEPSAVWVIANHDIKQPPDARGSFVSNPESDLHAFTDTDGGACFDTRDLYQAWRAVQTGELDAGEARAWMKNARGMGSWDPAIPSAD